jgi:hypothetical protein
MTIRSTLARAAAVVFATAVLLGSGAVAASAAALAGHDADPEPALAQTGYDFTPMLITAAVFLLIAGVTVIVAKYAVSRSSHS